MEEIEYLRSRNTAAWLAQLVGCQSAMREVEGSCPTHFVVRAPDWTNTQKRKVRNNFAPWLTPEIKRSMFERDKLRRASIINNSDAHWTEYKIARNNVNVAIRKAKTNYYKRYFETNIGNIKKSWKGAELSQQLK